MTLLASIPPPPLTSVHLGPLRITMFGVVVAVALLAGMSVTRRRYAAVGGDPELVERVLFWAIIGGFVGARVGYVITHTSRYVDRWWHVFAVWEGGLALFGGLTAGTLVAVVLVRRFGGDLGGLAGAAAVGIPVAQALGRPADYFSQELFGTPTDLPWALEVPERLRPEAFVDAATFHPAFAYEALWSAATVALLLVLKRGGVLSRGRLLATYAVAYGTGRFLLELIRTDTTFRLVGVSRNGWIALALLAAGTAGLIASRRRPHAVARTTQRPFSAATVRAPEEATSTSAQGSPRARADA